MVGEGDAIRSTILRVIRHQPIFPLFGRGDTRLQPVHRADVAAAIARLLTMEAPAPLYEFGGAETYRYETLVREVARAAGQRVWPVPVPFLAWRALALVASWVMIRSRCYLPQRHRGPRHPQQPSQGLRAWATARFGVCKPSVMRLRPQARLTYWRWQTPLRRPNPQQWQT